MAEAAVAWAECARLTRIGLLAVCYLGLVFVTGFAAGSFAPLASATGWREVLVVGAVVLLPLAAILGPARWLSRSPAAVATANLAVLADGESSEVPDPSSPSATPSPPPSPMAIRLRWPLFTWIWQPFIALLFFWNFARGEGLLGLGSWSYLVPGILLVLAAVNRYAQSRKPLALLGPDGVRLIRSRSSEPIPWSEITRVRPVAAAVWNPPHGFGVTYRSFLAWEMPAVPDLGRRLGIDSDDEYPVLSRRPPGFRFDTARVRPDALEIMRASRTFAAAAAASAAAAGSSIVVGSAVEATNQAGDSGPVRGNGEHVDPHHEL